jgi:geranylgeranyl diphosphate synthase type I
MPAAVAVELLHNFTLIHDDIEDQSPLRHGRPTLWKRYGTAQAINAGDALFSIAQISMLNLVETCGQYVVLDAMREFNRTCLHLTRGQHLDISFEHETDVTVSAYMEMIGGKTGALIAFAASLGPLTSGETLTEYRMMTEFGKALGLAFQIQDDILGIWGDPEITGKSAASDILTHKKTLPNLLGLEECPEFRTLWQEDNLPPDQIAEMAKLLESCGVRAQVKQQSEDLTAKAFQILDLAFKEKNDYAEALYEMTGLLLNREA